MGGSTVAVIAAEAAGAIVALTTAPGEDAGGRTTGTFGVVTTGEAVAGTTVLADKISDEEDSLPPDRTAANTPAATTTPTTAKPIPINGTGTRLFAGDSGSLTTRRPATFPSLAIEISCRPGAPPNCPWGRKDRVTR
jgi:hypothetical protein